MGKSSSCISRISPYLIPCAGMHPGRKLAYWKSAGWKPDWIETGRQIIRDTYDTSYAHRPISSDNQDADTASENAMDVVRCHIRYSSRKLT